MTFENQTTLKTPSRMLSEWMEKAFVSVWGNLPSDAPDIRATETTNPQFGDYQCNAALAMAGFLKRSPRDIASAVVEKAETPDCIEKIEVAGPGFINIYLKNEWLCRFLEKVSATDRFGTPMPGKGSTIVMDYGSPNMTKPLHIGHLRSANIGNVLDRLHRFLGYSVVSDNHLGDWGTQFGITIMGYRNFGDPSRMETAPLEELERVYVASYKKAGEDVSWMGKCREELVKLQKGDPENTKLWKKFMDLSLKEVNRVYARLGVSFDLARGESWYRDELPSVVGLLEEKGLAVESEGARVVFLEDEKLPVCIVRKKDGGFNYATTDIATILSRVSEFNPDRIVYVTDERQQLHFKQVFSVCRKLGCATRMDHVWFGLMRLPDATISTREGTVIKLDDLLDEAESRALALVKESSPNMPPAEQERISRAVGIGAVKYADLSQNPQSVVTFTWNKALALDGNSGPYLQYAYARIASVRDKYGEKFPSGDPDSVPLEITETVERSLALKLVRFSDIVERAADSYKPSVLTDYLYELAQTYSSFYQNVPFLKAAEGVRESRVRLCGAVARVLGKGLELLGLERLSRI